MQRSSNSSQHWARCVWWCWWARSRQRSMQLATEYSYRRHQLLTTLESAGHGTSHISGLSTCWAINKMSRHFQSSFLDVWLLRQLSCGGRLKESGLCSSDYWLLSPEVVPGVNPRDPNAMIIGTYKRQNPLATDELSLYVHCGGPPSKIKCNQ